jgi:hypothetical protein
MEVRRFLEPALLEVHRATHLCLGQVKAAGNPRASYPDTGHRTLLRPRTAQQQSTDHNAADDTVGVPAAATGRVITSWIPASQIHAIAPRKRIPDKALWPSQILARHSILKVSGLRGHPGDLDQQKAGV